MDQDPLESTLEGKDKQQLFLDEKASRIASLEEQLSSGTPGLTFAITSSLLYAVVNICVRLPHSLTHMYESNLLILEDLN